MQQQPPSASLGQPPSDKLHAGSFERSRIFGRYELFERLGRGGMGTVYRGMHTRLKRPVAVKLLRRDRVGHSGSVARFFREMEAVGRLDHPNLVRAYDAGESNGRHFLAMELVIGADLRELVGQLGPLGVADACEITIQAARGLHHAHRHGLVHRDVKPSNLMIKYDGTVKLLDLGCALLCDGEGNVPANSSSSQILGTGDYMAPEQGEDPRQADARSDLYALGCALYFMLAGHAPFEDTRHNTFGRKLLAHVTERVPDIALHRRALPKGLSGLLGRILAKCPGDRPADMAEVERALAGWIEGADLPGLVGRLSVDHRLGRSEAAAADTPRTRSATEPRCKPRARLCAPSEPPLVRPRRRLWQPVPAIAMGTMLLILALALSRLHFDGHVPEALNPAAMVQQPARLPGTFGWTLETRGGRAAVTHLALSSDDRLLAAADGTGCVRVWRTATGDFARLLVEPDPIRAAAWMSCGRRLAVAAGSLRLWDVRTGQLLWEEPLRESDRATSLDCGPDDALASGHQSGEIRLWNVSTRQAAKVLTGHLLPVTALRFSADGTRLASGDEGRTIRLWGLPDGSPLQRFDDAEPGPIRRLAWSPDATRLASCGGGRHVTIWDQSEAFRPRRQDAANQPVGDLGWSSKGQQFFSVSGGEAGMEFAVLWDGEVRQQIHRPLMAPNAATAMAWSRDGKAVYCGLRNGEILTYHPDSDGIQRFLPAATTRTTAIAWSPKGVQVVSGDCSGFSRLWNIEKAAQRLVVQASQHSVSVLAWHPEGRRFAAGHTDGVLVVVDASTGDFLHRVSCKGHVLDTAFSPGGQWLATAEEHGMCRVWNANTATELFRLSEENMPVVNAVAWSPDGRQLAFAAWDGRIRIADVEQRRVVRDWHTGQDSVKWMLWEPESAVLLTSSRYDGIAAWRAAEGVPLHRSEGGLPGGPRCTIWPDSSRNSCASGRMRGSSPDGQLIVQPASGSTLGVQHIGTGELRLALCPMPGGYWLVVNPISGYYRANLAASESLVYVVTTERGQENWAPAEFAGRFRWHNCPNGANIDLAGSREMATLPARKP